MNRLSRRGVRVVAAAGLAVPATLAFAGAAHAETPPHCAQAVQIGATAHITVGGQTAASVKLTDAAPATLRRHLGYKTGWYGSVLYVADRWYPSSKTCSGCQSVKPKLSLAEHTFNCTTCGVSLDRDVNAARNLAGLARHVDLELPGDAKTGRGAYVRPVRPAPAGGAAGREASRPFGGQRRPATDGCQS